MKRVGDQNRVPNWYISLLSDSLKRSDTDGFWSCGYELGRNAERHCDGDWEEEEHLLPALSRIWNTEDADDGKIRADCEVWLTKTFPRMVELIPPEGHEAFIDGFIQSLEDGLVV